MAVQHIATIHLFGAAGREDERRSNQRIRVPAPDRILGIPVEHPQHPVMARKVGEIPRHGRIRLSQRIGAIDKRDIIQLGAAHAFGLHDPEQASIMQVALRLRRQPPEFFGPGRTIAQSWNQRPGTRDHRGIDLRTRPRESDLSSAGRRPLP